MLRYWIFLIRMKLYGVEMIYFLLYCYLCIDYYVRSLNRDFRVNVENSIVL